MAGKGTRHRFELSRLEIAGVVVSAVAGLFVVFMLGIYAGRGMTDRRGVEGGEQIVRLPVAPAAEQTPAAEERLTFYDTLGQDERAVANRGERGADPAKVEAPKPAAEPPAPAPKAESDAAEKPADAAPPAEPAAADKATKPEESETAAAKPTDAPRRAAAPTPSPAAVAKSERSPAPPSTARVAVALATAATPRSQTKGDWSVQVSASRDPRTADAVLRRLRAKGYEAYVLRVRRRGETFYRVRVGHYASIEDAQQVVSRLRREPGVPEAFVASD